MSLKKIFVRVPRFIGTVQLDAVISEDHLNSIFITKNPVEAGADITDHAIVQPKKLIVKGAVSDSPLSRAAFGQLIDSISGRFGTSTIDNLTRTQQAYGALLLLMEQREPIQVTTGLRLYESMMIVGLTTSQDKNTSRMAMLNIALEEIVVTESVSEDIEPENIDPSVRKTATKPVEKGKEEVEVIGGGTDTTVLKTVTDWLSGDAT